MLVMRIALVFLLGAHPVRNDLVAIPQAETEECQVRRDGVRGVGHIGKRRELLLASLYVDGAVR